MNGRELCLWLNALDGGSADLLREMDSALPPLEILEALLKGEKITPRRAGKLRGLLKENWAEAELERADAGGVALLTWFDEGYPECLRGTEEPPLLLYVRGTLPDFKRACSVVGTRRCTPYGFKVSELLGKALAESGYTVVSGGARGIDGAAHGGALSAGGATVAVLGTGVDVIWPPEHDELFENILSAGGALVSEYPMGTSARTWRFPRRNRIIAGLSKHLVVVESPVKGGAMITARKAMEMGREVWAVPGRIDEKVCEGSNRLIFDGASPLVSIADFIEGIGGLGQLELFNPLPVSGDGKKVLDCLSERGDLTLDQIATRTGISVADLTGLMAELQANALIYPTGGGRWRSCPR